MGPSLYSFIFLQMSSYVAAFLRRTVRSTTLTSFSGTRNAMPVSLPCSDRDNHFGCELLCQACYRAALLCRHCSSRDNSCKHVTVPALLFEQIMLHWPLAARLGDYPTTAM